MKSVEVGWIQVLSVAVTVDEIWHEKSLHPEEGHGILFESVTRIT